MLRDKIDKGSYRSPITSLILIAASVGVFLLFVFWDMPIIIFGILVVAWWIFLETIGLQGRGE